MQARQAYYNDTTERISVNVSYPKGSHDRMPHYAYIWAQKGLGATNLIGKIDMKRRRPGEKERELNYRNKKLKKKGQKFANDPKTLIEFLFDFDAKYPIVDLKV